MRALTSGLLTAMVLAAATSETSAQEVTASDGWVMLPAEGETAASCFVTVNNPTMYDIYVVSAASELAEKVELRRTVDGEAAAVRELTVQAYGKLSMRPDGVHLKLLNLKRPVEDGESIPLTISTDGNIELRFQAVVRKE